jgi:MFS family permease
MVSTLPLSEHSRSALTTFKFSVGLQVKAMPGFLRVFGYPDPKNPIGYGIDSTVQQLIASLLTLGSFMSALLAGSFAAYFGRRHGIWCACVLNAVACAIQIGTDSVGALYVGRLLLGVANGFLVTFSNVYTAEASPAHLRGIIVALFAYWYVITVYKVRREHRAYYVLGHLWISFTNLVS